jgi:hypothetical protein
LGVNCTTKSFNVIAYVSGLGSGESVEITNNQGLPNETSITVNSILFPRQPIKAPPFSVQDGESYSLSITGQPRNKTCQLTNPTGTVDGAHISNIKVVCSAGRLYSIDGTIIGLGIGIQERTVTIGLNEGLDTIDFTTAPTLTPVNFGPFTELVPEGSTYTVDIVEQPVGQKCTVVSAGTGTVSGNVTNVEITCATYAPPIAKVIKDDFVANGGTLDGSSSTKGDSTNLKYDWSSSSPEDFSLTGNGTINPLGVNIYTDRFADPVVLDNAACNADPLCIATDMIKALANDSGGTQTAAVGTLMSLMVTGDEGHQDTDSDNNYIYNEKYAYVKIGGIGSGASPVDAAGDIQTGIAYAEANGKSMVAISQGSYNIDIDSGPITMVEGVSLSGGYSASTWEYDPESYTTEIRANGIGVVADQNIFRPLSTVLAGPEITEATFIRGLDIYGPTVVNDMATTALLIDGGDLTVKNNIIIAFDQRAEGWNGLTITGGSNALVKSNIIMAWESLHTGQITEARTGSGIQISDSTPTILANRIRGGGVRGTGIRVVGAKPNIFNNTILGCEDEAFSQSCFGVVYFGAYGQDVWEIWLSIPSSAGGKLYNNTIYGGMSVPDNISDEGGESIAVFLTGTNASPDIANNILYAQKASGSIWSSDQKAACIYSDNPSPGVIPASIYNNACIRGPDDCFHKLYAPKSKSWWEKTFGWVAEQFNYSFGQLLNTVSFGLIPSPPPPSDDFRNICRTAEESNADPLFETLENYSDFFTIPNLDYWVPSNGNVDINSAFFTSINGSDGDFATIDDNDWSLTASTPWEVREGGKCLGPDINTDITLSKWRTPNWDAINGCQADIGWSIGAYEY